jgi:hypothetical protein
VPSTGRHGTPPAWVTDEPTEPDGSSVRRPADVENYSEPDREPERTVASVWRAQVTRRPPRLWWIALAVVAVLALTALGLDLLYRPQAESLRNVTGRVTCASGAAVVGVYIETRLKSSSGFAAYHPSSETGSVATFAYSVPKDRSYQVQVGCGGTRSNWATNDRSDQVDGDQLSFLCLDDIALAEHNYYGHCSLAGG